MEILWYLHRGIGVKANLHYTEDKPWVARYNCLFYCVQELLFLVVHGAELPYKTKDCAWWLLACLSVDWPLTSSKFGVLKLHSTIFHHRLKIAARYQIFTLMEYTCFMNCQHCFLTECSFNKKVPLLQSCFFIRWDNLHHFFAETLRLFFCWDILATETFWSFVSQGYQNSPQQCSLAYIFRHSDWNYLIFFSHFKNISVYDQKKQLQSWKHSSLPT